MLVRRKHRVALRESYAAGMRKRRFPFSFSFFFLSFFLPSFLFLPFPFLFLPFLF